MDNFLKEGERLDDLEQSNLKIIQNPSKFCFGMDAVLLTGFIKIKVNEEVVDLGTGTGIIPILLTAKTKAKHYYALEIQADMADMAARSVAYNHIEDKIDVICGDIKEASKLLKSGNFDVVTCNPPYMNDMHGLKNPDEALAIARHEIKCNLDDIIREGAKLLKSGGRYYMVHRPHRLIEIFMTMKNYGLEPKRICMVHPYADKEANMVLIEAVKGGGAWMKVEAPIVVYKEPGKYTQQIYDIYGY